MWSTTVAVRDSFLSFSDPFISCPWWRAGDRIEIEIKVGKVEIWGLDALFPPPPSSLPPPPDGGSCLAMCGPCRMALWLRPFFFSFSSPFFCQEAVPSAVFAPNRARNGIHVKSRHRGASRPFLSSFWVLVFFLFFSPLAGAATDAKARKRKIRISVSCSFLSLPFPSSEPFPWSAAGGGLVLSVARGSIAKSS